MSGCWKRPRDASNPLAGAAEICLHLHQQPGRILYDPGGQPLLTWLSWRTTSVDNKHRPDSPPQQLEAIFTAGAVPLYEAAGQGLRRSWRPQLQAYGICDSCPLAELAEKDEGLLARQFLQDPAAAPSSPLRSWTSTTPSLTCQQQERLCRWPASSGKDRRSFRHRPCASAPAPDVVYLPGGGPALCAAPNSCFWIYLKRVFDPYERGGERLCLPSPATPISAPEDEGFDDGR